MQVVFQPQRDNKGPDFHSMTARNNPSNPVPVEGPKPEIARKPYQFLHVNVLREYLAMELAVQTPFPFDPERAYDDFGALLPPLQPALGAAAKAACCLTAPSLCSSARRRMPLADAGHIAAAVTSFLWAVQACLHTD